VSESAAKDPVDQALGALDHALDLVHDRVVRPITLAARAVAFGLVIAVAALVVALALAIGLTRLMNVYLFAGHEWITYGGLGVVFLVAGMALWRRRRASA
jgi:protein-S-isoprenylcysteine O-methyltransferase Ste14